MCGTGVLAKSFPIAIRGGLIHPWGFRLEDISVFSSRRFFYFYSF